MEIILILGLILLSGLLSMAEISLVSARKARLESQVKKGKRSAQKALDLAQKPDQFLSTTQIGITLIGILTGLFSGEAFARDLAGVLARVPGLEPYAVGISKLTIVVIVTYLTLVLGELAPKRIGMNFAEQVAELVARPMDILSKVASPIVWVLSKSTQGVILLLGLNRTGENKVTEEEIVERVFTLGDRDVGSIMTHRSDLIWLNMQDGMDAIRRKVKENLYNVYPVASERFDNIVGVVFLKDLFGRIDQPDFTLQQVLRPAQFVPESQSVYNALEQFKQARVKYGIVTDEFGGVQGLVTLADIVEALIGQLPDVDEELEIKQRADGSWLVDGQYSFYNFLEYFDMEDLYADYDYNTLSGLILELLERVPKTGDTFSWQCFDFEIVDMDRARIDKGLVKKHPVANT